MSKKIKKSLTSTHIVILLCIMSLAVALPLFYVFTTHAEPSELSFSYIVHYSDGTTGPLSIFYNSKEISSIDVSINLHLEVTGTVSSATLNGQLITSYDGEQRLTKDLTFPSVPENGTYELASQSVTESQMNTWSASQSGSHILFFETSDPVVLTVIFDDGTTDTKSFNPLNAQISLTYQSPNTINVAEIEINVGTEDVPPNPSSGVGFGWSSYPRTNSGTYTTDAIDLVIQRMDENDLTVYRMAFNDFRDIDTIVIPYVRYYLDHCNYDIIIDHYHQYPMGSLTSAQLTETTSRTLAIWNEFGSNPRIKIEPWNERSNNDMPSQAQTFISNIRSAGCNYGIVIDKWDHSWSDMQTVSESDPLNQFYTGYHYYFTNGAWTTAEQQMQYALDRNLKIINTEIGADYNEAGQFQQSEVDRVNQFNAWCEQRGITNTVWMVYGEQNLPTYINMGLRNPLTGNLIH